MYNFHPFKPVDINATVTVIGFDDKPISTFVKESESLLSGKVISTERGNIKEYKSLKEE